MSYLPIRLESSNLKLYRLRNDQKSSTDQSAISPFDNKFGLMFFDFLTRKTHEMDFDVCIRNVSYVLATKWHKNNLNLIVIAQDIAKIPQDVKARKLPFFCS